MPGPRAGCGPRPAGAVTRGRGTCGPSPGHRAILRGQISLLRRLVGGERRSAPVQGTQKASWSMDLHCTRPWGWAFWERESGLPCARTWPVGQGPGGGACRRSGTPGHGAAAPADPRTGSSCLISGSGPEWGAGCAAATRCLEPPWPRFPGLPTAPRQQEGARELPTEHSDPVITDQHRRQPAQAVA